MDEEKKTECAEENDAPPKKENANMVSFMSMGLCLGLSLGMLLFDNMAIGMCVGLSLGLAVGAALDEKAFRDKVKVWNEAHPEEKISDG